MQHSIARSLPPPSSLSFLLSDYVQRTHTPLLEGSYCSALYYVKVCVRACVCKGTLLVVASWLAGCTSHGVLRKRKQ